MGATSGRASTVRAKWGGLRVLVIGLGRFGGGVGAIRWLSNQGAAVTVTDQADEASLAASLEAIADLPVELQLGSHDHCDLSTVDLVVVNPAVVKSRSTLFQQIAENGVPWTTEVNLFCERCPAPVVGVTGSYGKSTTCAMLACVLGREVSAGRSRFTGVHLGGNIGGSLLTILDSMQHSDIVVLELSNAQLEDLPRIGWLPNWAVVTNLHPHHLDRYESASQYYHAKLNLLRRGARGQSVVVGDLNAEAEGMLLECVAGRPEDLHRLSRDSAPIALELAGRHNQANARCVRAICGLLGVEERAVRESLASFRGLPHRLETVEHLDGVWYVNDSKSTSPDATSASVEAVDGPLIVIVGGEHRVRADYAGCAAALAGRCRAILCTGASARCWADAVRTQAAACDLDAPEVQVVRDLAEAVAAAAHLSRPGDTVLFSPGGPSFDAYTNFAERGAHFKRLVRAGG